MFKKVVNLPEISNLIGFQNMDIIALKDKILSGNTLTDAEAYLLAEIEDEEMPQLWEAAAEITEKMCSRKFDSCSIVNARSGKCSEDCKWCAQSAHYKTDIECYPFVDHDRCMKIADLNREQGIGRLSLVTSGRKLNRRELDTACSYYEELRSKGSLNLCASMGLLEREELERLRQSGVTRYHCNLETAPSFFPQMCSTHTLDEKIKTIRASREAGLEVCSGGIIGLGESRKQRVELALELRKINPLSIPINILCPIPGTPLENAEPLSQEEILTTMAIFRFIHPGVTLRFAGGRAKLQHDNQIKAIKMAINGAIMADMLTTIGSKVDEDKEMISQCGYEY